VGEPLFFTNTLPKKVETAVFIKIEVKKIFIFKAYGEPIV
jgi:hypothetical protein